MSRRTAPRSEDCTSHGPHISPERVPKNHSEQELVTEHGTVRNRNPDPAPVHTRRNAIAVP